MRKASIFLITAVLAVSLIGCSQQANQAGVDESPPSSFSAGESSQTPKPSEETMATAEPETTTTAPTSESEQSVTTTSEVETKQSGNQIDDGQSQTPQTKPPAETPKPTQSPAVTEPPKVETPAVTPQPTDPPKPKTAYDAPYNTATIIADARAYGESIGMTWSEPLTTDNCSWEAPGATSSTLSGERLKAAIEACIRRVKKLQTDNQYQPGEFHFKLLLVPVSGGEYSFYLLMG